MKKQKDVGTGKKKTKKQNDNIKKQDSKSADKKPIKHQEVKYPEFGKRLKQCRTSLSDKMTQLELYTELYGKDDVTDVKSKIDKISCWERGIYFPAIGDLMKLADIFQVSVDYLIGRNEGKHVDTDRICTLTGLSAITVDSLIYDQSRKNSKVLYELTDPFQFFDFETYKHSAKSERTLLIDSIYQDTELLKSIRDYFIVSTFSNVYLDGDTLKKKNGDDAEPEDLEVGSPYRDKLPIDKDSFTFSKLIKIKNRLDSFDTKSLDADKVLKLEYDLPEPLVQNNKKLLLERKLEEKRRAAEEEERKRVEQEEVNFLSWDDDSIFDLPDSPSPDTDAP